MATLRLRDPRPDRPAAPSVPSGPSGRLAQLVERLPYKQEVTGSSPVPPIAELPADAAVRFPHGRLCLPARAAWTL